MCGVAVENEIFKQANSQVSQVRSRCSAPHAAAPPARLPAPGTARRLLRATATPTFHCAAAQAA